MSIEKLQRVMIRVRQRNPGKTMVNRAEMSRAIMLECGTSPMTYYNNYKAMVRLGWIKKRKGRFTLTGLDLNDDYK